MAGHSHAANIRHRKNAVDAKKGKLFSKLAKGMISAARQGGGDLESNPKLRLAVEKAKAANMTRDSIERAIKKGTGEGAEGDYEELIYEGYAPGGVAVMVACLTDNRNRTAPDIKHIFDKRGGNLGASGSVAFMFDFRAIFVVENGDRDVHADITRLTVSLSRRIGRRIEVGGGFDVYANRRHANGLGGWAEAIYRRSAPFTSVALRGHWNEVLHEPAAAAGLGGTSHGVETEVHYESEADWWWTSGRLSFRSLSFEHPEHGRMTDGQAIVNAVLGTRVFRRGPEIRRSFSTRRLPTVETGTTVFGEPPQGMGHQIDAWLGYTGIRLLDDGELDGPLPLGGAYDYVTATGRVVGPAGRGLLYEAELYLGTDLQDPGLFVGGTVGLAWRPSTDLELKLSGSHGIDFGYEGGEGATRLSLTMTLRW